MTRSSPVWTADAIMPREQAIPSMRVTGAVRRLVVVLGDQLDRSSAVFDGFDERHDAVLMMEVEEESTHVPSHRQRTVLFLSAMRHFANDLHERGRRVQYVRLDDGHNTHSLGGEIRRQVQRLEPESIVCTHPGEWRVLDMMKGLSADLGIPVEIQPDRHFFVQPEEFEDWARDRRSLIMEHFYREQRKRLGILVDDHGKPEGGAWNYDRENREAFTTAPELRRPYQARPDNITREVIDVVERRLPDLPGRLEAFGWPVTRTEAKRALRDFVEYRLVDFGRYEDAMWTDQATVYHSRLSAALNLKLLSPRECVDAALAAYRDGNAPLNSVEGFVRQLIGWREFIRGVYWLEGAEYAERNGLDHHGSLPEMYWSGDTDMACMRQCLGQVRDEAYGHHIQRLMVTGNFALLSGVHPRAVSDWYLGMYVDAIDWVTLPNTLGMAMHADGGVVGTKPYAASGKYISRMSNYCDECRYNVNERTGEAACPFNTLYWDFLIRHRERFRKNNRMAMMLKNVDRMTREQRTEITVSAGSLREKFGIGSITR